MRTVTTFDAPVMIPVVVLIIAIMTIVVIVIAIIVMVTVPVIVVVVVMVMVVITIVGVPPVPISAFILRNARLAKRNQPGCSMPVAHAVLLAAVIVVELPFALVRHSHHLAAHAPAVLRDVIFVHIREGVAEAGVTHGHQAGESEDLLEAHVDG